NLSLQSVVKAGTACVSGPIGNGVQSWDIQPGGTYTLTFKLLGTSDLCPTPSPETLTLTLSASFGNLSFTPSKSNTDPSIYTATITIPAVSCSTTNIKYCGPPSMFVRRNDGQEFEAHLRASTFGANCSNPTTISCQDQGCTTPPVLSGCPGQSSVTFQ